MKLTVTKSAGFCYGVHRAIELAEAAARSGKPCVMLGPIIHNNHVIEHLAALGVACAERMEDVPQGAAVLLRSHGEPRAVRLALEARGAEILDATCPNVTKIHRLVAEADETGTQSVIIGTPDHPEVLAIAGHCTNPMVFEDAEALETWLLAERERRNLPLILVSQTTLLKETWDRCVNFTKKVCTNAKFFDTICSATTIRQSEAQTLAAQSDAMLVIGDRKSSNTQRLAQLCRSLCPKVLCIEGAEELSPRDCAGLASVGITAGASTPGWIIKEVYDKMSEEMMEIEESFAELLEKSIKTLNSGEKVTGIVTGITPMEIYVDLGTKHAGYLSIEDFTDDLTVDLNTLIHVGDEIETFVMRVNDAEGIVNLSRKRLDTLKSWEDVEAALTSGEPVEGIVMEENKGGIVVSVKGVRVFVPASQTGIPREGAMSVLIKKSVKMKITEVNKAKKRVVGSIRKATEGASSGNAAKVWEEIEIGKRYTGTVKSLTDYGAFVDVGGVDGMVHISELSWSRVKHPSDAVAIGDTVDVYVINFDLEKHKISLGMKDRAEDPWAKFTAKYQAGDTANVKIVKLMTFGAFAELVPGVDGLIHISQLADHRVDRPGDVVAEGDMVDVRILEIDTEHKKVSLSIRALLEEGDCCCAGETCDCGAEPATAEEVPAAVEAPVEAAPAAE